MRPKVQPVVLPPKTNFKKNLVYGGVAGFTGRLTAVFSILYMLAQVLTIHVLKSERHLSLSPSHHPNLCLFLQFADISNRPVQNQIANGTGK